MNSRIPAVFFRSLTTATTKHGLRALFLIHSSFFILCSASAQPPRGRFLTDTVEIGKPFRYALSIRHRAVQEVFFPDTARHFAPFLVRDIALFSTVTDTLGSLDSVVYTLVSFEIKPLQTLRVPVFLLKNTKDCTAVFSNTDTVRLRERIATNRPDTLRLATQTEVAPLQPQMNYPFLVTILAILGALTGLIFVVFGKSINRQLRLYRYYRQHYDFDRLYSRLTRNINPDNASVNAGKAVIAWKEYLEWLEQKPFSTMTTREIADAIYDSRLADALKEMDGVVYGGMYSDRTQMSLRILYEIADSAYRRQRLRILNVSTG